MRPNSLNFGIRTEGTDMHDTQITDEKRITPGVIKDVALIRLVSQNVPATRRRSAECQIVR